MKQNSADFPRKRVGRHWLNAAELVRALPDARLRGWLRWNGLLTAALREACGEGFRLQLLRQHDTRLDEHDRMLPDTAGKHGVCREIVMGDDRHLYVYARTLAPDATVAAHPWLRTLGEESLGDRLQRAGLPAAREAFRFARLEPYDSLLAGLPPASEDAVWARHSVFRLAGGPLSILEVFLPPILDCELPQPS
jgi:chorismate-pyruvate lyase